MTVCPQNRHFIIYKITNQVNGKVYIGQTVKTLKRRKEGHIRDAMLGSGCAIHRAIRKYGIENFRFETLFHCLSKEETDQREVETIKAMCAKCPAGYNLTDGGKGASGHIVSDETREKMRIVMTGQRFPAERRAKAGKAHIGLKHSDETKAKMSKAHMGNKYCLGKKATAETRVKLSLAKKGKRPNNADSPKTEKWYAAMSSPEQKEKIKASWITRRQQIVMQPMDIEKQNLLRSLVAGEIVNRVVATALQISIRQVQRIKKNRVLKWRIEK
jgi:predicted GIY-YIG superfamily endonuclease